MTHFGSLNARVGCPHINSLINTSLTNAYMFKYFSLISKTGLNVRLLCITIPLGESKNNIMEVSLHWGKSLSLWEGGNLSNKKVKCVFFHPGGKAAICSNAAHFVLFLNNTHRADFYGNRTALMPLGGTD